MFKKQTNKKAIQNQDSLFVFKYLERSFFYVLPNANISIKHYSGYPKTPSMAIFEDLRKRFEGQGRKARPNG